MITYYIKITGNGFTTTFEHSELIKNIENGQVLHFINIFV